MNNYDWTRTKNMSKRDKSIHVRKGIFLSGGVQNFQGWIVIDVSFRF